MGASPRLAGRPSGGVKGYVNLALSRRAGRGIAHVASPCKTAGRVPCRQARVELAATGGHEAGSLPGAAAEGFTTPRARGFGHATRCVTRWHCISQGCCRWEFADIDNEQSCRRHLGGGAGKGSTAGAIDQLMSPPAGSTRVPSDLEENSPGRDLPGPARAASAAGTITPSDIKRPNVRCVAEYKHRMVQPGTAVGHCATAGKRQGRTMCGHTCSMDGPSRQTYTTEES
eukprot:366561-Chlamydomonas_euryale.AAC.8